MFWSTLRHEAVLRWTNRPTNILHLWPQQDFRYFNSLYPLIYERGESIQQVGGSSLKNVNVEICDTGCHRGFVVGNAEVVNLFRYNLPTTWRR